MDALLFTEYLISNIHIPLNNLTHPIHHFSLLFFPAGVARDEIAVVWNNCWVFLTKHVAHHGLASHVRLLCNFVLLHVPLKISESLQS